MQYKYYIKDLVYGANDGIITTFAVVSGVVGAGLSSTTIVIIGLASLAADAFSMASSNYLGSRSEMLVNNLSRHTHHVHTKPMVSASLTFIAFVFAGIMPLLPYLFLYTNEYVFYYAMGVTAITLFVVGSLRTLATKKPAIAGGLEMLIIGGVAAIIAYGVGSAISAFVS